MIAAHRLPAGVAVPLAPGLWAVGLVLLGVLLAAAMWPLLRRPQEDPVCNEPGSLGRHQLGDPDPAGVQRCDCGRVSRRPAAAARTDTVEASYAELLEPMPDNPGELLARASTHPSVWELPTDEAPLPHIVWPPA